VKIVCLPGDGIGPEVMSEAVRALRVLEPEIAFVDCAIGGAAIEDSGDPLPPETLDACRDADAVLMGAAGAMDLRWGDANPEDGMFRLRRELGVFANLRPSNGEGIDLLIVRELLGGLYFGERGTTADGTVYDTCAYHPDHVDRLVRRGFELARERRCHVTSVDKANVLATSRMWREVADRVARDFPDVELEHLLVDTAALQLVQDPGRFDVIVTENTFGDILSDLAAGLTGGLGLAPSASLGDRRPGLFEPVHGSAPDIAGDGVANPAAMLLSASLMLRHGLHRLASADALDRAVEVALREAPTRDLGGSATTAEFGDHVEAALRAEARGVEARTETGG
jgi:3-isopropylmalate dehydrogenase